MNHTLQKRLIKTAERSPCRYKIAAIGLNGEGQVIAAATNLPRFPRHGGGLHAEREVMKKAPKSLKEIWIVRLGQSGEMRPIRPCDMCAKVAKKLGVRIRSIVEA